MNGRTCALVLSLAAGCGAARGTALPAPLSPALAYEVALDEDLGTMRVTVCPGARPLPAALVPIHDEARAHLRAAVLVEGDRVVAPLATPRLDLRDAPSGACARYAVDLAGCTAPRGPASCVRVGRDVYAPTSAWLLAPETRHLADRISLHFVLPAGVAATPFAPGTDSIVVDDRFFAFVTHVALTHAPRHVVAVPGGCIDAVTLEGSLDRDEASRDRWLASAARASALVTGRVPFDRLTAIVGPAPDVPSMPVLFGIAGRGMRPTVTLWTSEHATEAALVTDWTAVHELAHLLTAYLEGEDAWLSEGLATYYQEVLRARAGLVPEADAWRAILEGLDRGRATPGPPALREAARTMHATHAYGRVYWGGAALVLRADVAYRRAGSSLDAAVARAWEHRGERADDAQLIRWLDGVEDGVLARLATAGLDAEAFPDVSDELAWLGVHRTDGQVVLDDAAPGAAARRALMNDAPPLASNPGDCGDSF